MSRNVSGAKFVVGLGLMMVVFAGTACGLKAVDVPATVAYEVFGRGQVFTEGSRRPAGSVHKENMNRIFLTNKKIHADEDDTSVVLSTFNASGQALVYGALKRSIYKEHGVRALKQCHHSKLEVRVAGTQEWHWVGGGSLSEYSADEDLSRRTFFNLGDLFPRNKRGERPNTFIWEVLRTLEPAMHQLDLRWIAQCEDRKEQSWEIVLLEDQVELDLNEKDRTQLLLDRGYYVEPPDSVPNGSFTKIARRLLNGEGQLRIVRPMSSEWHVKYHDLSHAVVSRSYDVDYVGETAEGGCRRNIATITQDYLTGSWQSPTAHDRYLAFHVACDTLPRR